MDRPIPRPYPMGLLPATFEGWELPSLRSMLDRAIALQGTNMFRITAEAMMIRAVLEQAINLSNIANYARQDAWDASELAFAGHGRVHHSLRHLHREVAFRTIDMWKQYERQERLEEARKRRAEKKAAESSQDPPPRKRRSTKGEAQAGESARASMKNPAATNREDISHVE
ncbi:hypothetical protein [Delftia deserti]|uniref:Uncharacterized protein n=1 Tax=Delftia deserti TaxID=1651218 RepID=A0ABW5EQU8_9BURK